MTGLFVVLALLALSGCDYARNATKSDRARASGLIGKCYELQQDAMLVRGKRPSYLSLRPVVNASITHTDTVEKVIGTIPRGTRPEIRKLTLFNYGLLPTPALAQSDIPYTLARILDGQYAGKEVSTGSLGLDAYSPWVNEKYFKPCAQSMD